MSDNEKLSRACERLEAPALFDLLDKQTDLVHFRNLAQFKSSAGDELKAESNEEVWSCFVEEELYDTRRLVLEQFHLFDWFPLAPGKFHTARAKTYRRDAARYLERTPDGKTFFNPLGKGMMINGGVGTVHLLPRTIQGEPHHFMSTAPSDGRCSGGASRPDVGRPQRR